MFHMTRTTAHGGAVRPYSEASRTRAVASICGTFTGGGTHSEHPCAIRHFGPPRPLIRLFWGYIWGYLYGL